MSGSVIIPELMIIMAYQFIEIIRIIEDFIIYIKAKNFNMLVFYFCYCFIFCIFKCRLLKI